MPIPPQAYLSTGNRPTAAQNLPTFVEDGQTLAKDCSIVKPVGRLDLRDQSCVPRSTNGLDASSPWGSRSPFDIDIERHPFPSLIELDIAIRVASHSSGR